MEEEKKARARSRQLTNETVARPICLLINCAQLTAVECEEEARKMRASRARLDNLLLRAVGEILTLKLYDN